MRRAIFNPTNRLIASEIREAFKGAVDLILPFKCTICGDVADTNERFGTYSQLYESLYGTVNELHLCGKCLSKLSINEEDSRWFLCLSDPIENDPCPGLVLFMPFTYKGIVERVIPRIKFGKDIELARLFGGILGTCFRNEKIKADLIVPIPLSEARLVERGFNQAEEIAYPVARMNDIPLAKDCLIRTKNTKRQSEIRDVNIRAKNVSGAFSVNDSWDVSGLRVIVVDDVATTGATLHEAAKALYRAGASKVLCVAFAGNRKTKNGEPF